MRFSSNSQLIVALRFLFFLAPTGWTTPASYESTSKRTSFWTSVPVSTAW